MIKYDIRDLNLEAREFAIKTVIKHLAQIGFELNINNNGDITKAIILSENLRIKFNEVGGLA